MKLIETEDFNSAANTAPLQKEDFLFPGYTVIHHMNRGKDCDVYYVWSEERLSGCIAKTVQPHALDNQDAKKRVIKEGEYLKALSHPNLVRGYEIVESPIPILIQETLTGETVSHLIRSLTARGEFLPVKQLAHLGMQLSSAVHYLHQNNILHLDLKPSNIISQPPLAKVIDLNLAAEPGEIKKGTGTRQYMSPEQARGDILTKAADVWGIGAVLFFAATGKRPFRSAEDGRYEQLERPAEPVQAHRQMNPSLADLINRCLQENTNERPGTKEIHEFLQLFTEKEAN
jgi:serine/threonine protein kinase